MISDLACFQDCTVKNKSIVYRPLNLIALSCQPNPFQANALQEPVDTWPNCSWDAVPKIPRRSWVICQLIAHSGGQLSHAACVGSSSLFYSPVLTHTKHLSQALRILRTEEPGRLQSMGSRKSWTRPKQLRTHTHTHWGWRRESNGGEYMRWSWRVGRTLHFSSLDISLSPEKLPSTKLPPFFSCIPIHNVLKIRIAMRANQWKWRNPSSYFGSSINLKYYFGQITKVLVEKVWKQ